jgi:hypothetical protein
VIHVGTGSPLLHRIIGGSAGYRADMSDGWTETATDAATCARMFGDFARTTRTRAPLYSRMADGIAGDEALAGLLLFAPPAQRQPVLLFACVHDLLLSRADGDAELARYYPNLTANPDDGDPLPALRRLCADHAAALTELLSSRSTQTNEIGRCALLLPAFGLLGAEVGPLAHLDVGTSAGLNLLLDRYRYRYEPGGSVGPASGSPVELECGTRGAVPVPRALPAVADRIGLDRAPVDVHDDDATRWLEACVWPDQPDRFERLRTALAIARRDGVVVRRGDAVTDTPALVDSLAGSAHPVITNTWVLNYLSGAARTAYVEALDAVGARLDLSWVYVESPYLTPELPGPDGSEPSDRTALVLVRWRSGHRTVEHLADAHPHGYWLHWQ